MSEIHRPKGDHKYPTTESVARELDGIQNAMNVMLDSPYQREKDFQHALQTYGSFSTEELQSERDRLLNQMDDAGFERAINSPGGVVVNAISYLLRGRNVNSDQ